MATVEELRTSIEEKRAALREAISAAGGTWEVEPAPGEWTPRQTGEHAIGMEWMYGGLLAGALGAEAPPGRDLALTSSADALSALEAAIEDCSPLLQRVTDADLAKPAELRGEVPSPDIPKTVEGVLWLTAFHLDDHAQQIAAAATAQAG
jgi:hypothetical protein